MFSICTWSSVKTDFFVPILVLNTIHTENSKQTGVSSFVLTDNPQPHHKLNIDQRRIIGHSSGTVLVLSLEVFWIDGFRPRSTTKRGLHNEYAMWKLNDILLILIISILNWLIVTQNLKPVSESTKEVYITLSPCTWTGCHRILQWKLLLYKRITEILKDGFSCHFKNNRVWIVLDV